MKRNSIIFLLLFTVFIVAAQSQADEFRKKGDEAMKILEFRSAIMPYEEAVYNGCDMHSIGQLTWIWQYNDSLRTFMDYVMKQCLICLNDNARASDTTSMNLLVTYYTEGIGMDKNEVMAAMWSQQLEQIRNPYQVQTRYNGVKPPRDNVKMQFFAGYSPNLLAPAGLTVGGVGSFVGWYLRFRTNLSFQDYTKDYDDATETIIGGLNNGSSLPERLGGKKTNMLIGTGGLIVVVNPTFYLSAGVGYCSREVLYQFQSIGIVDSNPEGEFWAKRISKSFSGVALDMDGTFRIGKQIYGSIGISWLNLEYVYPNAGIGVFF